MTKKVLTDTELRARLMGCRGGEYHVEEDTILTPAARDFLREQDIRLCTDSNDLKTMTVSPLPVVNGRVQYQNAETGELTEEKGELMTHLRENLLVPKTHPRIRFRGYMDCLQAQWLRVQLIAEEAKNAPLANALEELLRYQREILAAEVLEKPLDEPKLMGMSSREIRKVSHQVKEHIGIDHPIPSHKMGRLCVELNCLRAEVRRAELAAAEAFTDEAGHCSRMDIIEGLNRLSSCVYILFCREAAEQTNRRKPNVLL